MIWRTVKAVSRSLLAITVASLLLGLGSAYAKVEIKTEVFDQDGYIRLVFDWPDRPRATAEIENGVLVIYFEEPFSTDLKSLRKQLKPYVSRVRQDNENKTLRLALKGELKLFTAVVDNQLALDLLPMYWRKPPPPFYGTAPNLASVEKMIAELRSEAAERTKIEMFDPPPPYLALNVPVGEHSNFTRIVFEWPELVEYSLLENNGRIGLTFNKNARPKLTRFRVDPPKFVLGADYKNKQKILQVEFQVEPDALVKHFRDGTKVVLDLWPPAPEAEIAETHSGNKDHKVVQEGDQSNTHTTEPVATADPIMADEVNHDAEDKKIADAGSVLDTAVEENNAPTDRATNDADFHRVRKSAVSGAGEKIKKSVAEQQQTTTVATSRTVPKSTGKASVDVKVVAHEDQTRLKFLWPHQVEAAVFRRADHIWVVFSEEADIDLTQIDRRVRQHIAKADLLDVSQGSAIRLHVPEGTYASVDAKKSEWIVTIAEEKRTPRQGVPISSFAATPSTTKVVLELGSPATVYWLKDPEIGDDLAVVTAAPEIRGISATRKLVDFSLGETAHGVFVEPSVDDLFVGLDPEGNILVRSLSGLSLSTPDRTAWGTGESILKYISRPAFVDVEEWKTELDFASRRHELQLAVSSGDGPELEAARFDLARFYIAHQLAAEALGVVKLIVQDNASSENTAAIRAIRGISNLMLGRLKEATKDLEHRLLENDADAGVWQGLAAYKIEKPKKAGAHFSRSRPVLEEYPKSWSRKFLLAAAQASLGADDIDGARSFLAEIPTPASGRIEDPVVQWVHARALQAEGNTDAAIELYQKASRASDISTAVRSRFDSIRLLTEVGSITKDEAIDRLDGLRFQWRGDVLELEVLAALGNLMIEEDRYREGLGVLRTAVTHYPNERLARTVTDDMSAAFAALYLDGEADLLPPIQSLALFYDYRELTPIGRRGDDMIRRLADRLSEVDLLEQAADLLVHQVENRLQGVAKAQVAARLAMVYLLDRKPEAALMTIRKTRQGRLPTRVGDQRRLLEARALADLGFGDKAKDLLTDDTSPEAKRLKADIDWQMGEWKTAAKAFEKLLGPRWQNTDLLSSSERLDVMRSAIGYSLAEDDFALGRLRDRYAEAMAESVDASAFDIVTQNVERDGLAFRELVKGIANTSTLDAFVKDVKRRYDSQTLSALN